MDEKSIYVKTAQGEVAANDLGLPLQRELRALLILVDGQTTVADLRQKQPEGPILQRLEELEKLGFIAPRASPDRADAAPALQDLDFLPLDAASPSQAVANDDWSAMAPAVRVLPGYVPPMVKRPPRAGFLDRFARRKPVATTPDEADLPPTQTNEPHRRRTKHSWPWFALSVAGLAVLLALLMAGQALWGHDHRPQIASSMAAALGQPVEIGRVSIGFSPWPTLTVEDVQIGEQATIRRLDLWPTLASFWTAEKTLHRVRLSGLHLNAEGLPAAAGWLAAERRGPIKVQDLAIDDLSFAFAGMEVGGLSGQAQLTADGVPIGLTLRDARGHAHIELKPHDGVFALNATLSDWPGPGRDRLRLPILRLEGTLEPLRWHLSGIEGTLFDGRIEGSGVLQRDGQGVRLEAQVKLARVELHALLDALGGSLGIGGPAVGSLNLSARAPDMAHLLDDLRIEGALQITSGTLHKLDLIAALRQPGQAVEDGEMRFERLSGRLTASAQGATMTHLQLESGLLRATGTLSRQGSGLTGSFHLVLGDGVSGEVVVGGTIARPILKATGR